MDVLGVIAEDEVLFLFIEGPFFVFEFMIDLVFDGH